jgi:hypothetical protein
VRTLKEALAYTSMPNTDDACIVRKPSESVSMCKMSADRESVQVLSEYWMSEFKSVCVLEECLQIGPRVVSWMRTCQIPFDVG